VLLSLTEPVGWGGDEVQYLHSALCVGRYHLEALISINEVTRRNLLQPMHNSMEHVIKQG
jgi:hypothetical protein